MNRIRAILARRYWRLTGWQWLLLAVIVGGVLYVWWRRREEEAGFEEGVEGEEDRGGASELGFEPQPVEFVEIPPSELDEGSDVTIGILDEILLAIGGLPEAIAEAVGPGVPTEELPPWRQRIRELREKQRARVEASASAIDKLRAGGVTVGERRRISRIRARRLMSKQRTRERIQAIRQRNADTAPTSAGSSAQPAERRRDAPLAHASVGARTSRVSASRQAASRIAPRPAPRIQSRGHGGRRRGR